MNNAKTGRFSPAIKVIIIFGIISMLGDMVYESARSANSQYFNLIGITAAQIGLVFGIGEFLGYFLRLIAGVLSDKSGKHWLFIFVGYGMLAVVPIIGITMNWNILIILILMERIGKSLRNPAKDTILSGVAENQVGTGFAFGLQEALDQIGAFAGPLIFTFVFYITGKNGLVQYKLGYQALIIPFALLMMFVFYAYRKIKRDDLIPILKTKEFRSEKLKPIFWIYMAFTFFSTLGFVNFALIGFHLKSKDLMSDGNITLLYAGAMAIDALTAVLIGKAYDKMKDRSGKKTGGIIVLLMIPFITALLPFLSLSRWTIFIIAGMAIFGVVMGVHETIMRSAIADITPFYKRGTSFGVFNTGYGLALLAGAALMGWLYDKNLIGIIISISCVTEFIAVFFFIWMNLSANKTEI